jgi:hypothetical protein
MPVVEDYVKKGAVTRMSAKALPVGKSIMETSGSPVALKSGLVKPGCLAPVSEPVRLPQLQPVFAPLLPDRACVAAGIPRPEYKDSESVAVMDPISSSMGTDDTDELDTTSEESVVGHLVALVGTTSVCMKFPENFSTPSICPAASDTLVEVLAPLRSITAPQHAVHEKPMVTRFSTSTPPNFASPLARTTPTAAMEHASFPPLKSYLPSSMPLLGY